MSFLLPTCCPKTYLSIYSFNRYQLTTDAILLAVTKRVVTTEHEEKIMELLGKYSDTLRPDTRSAIMRDINNNKLWRASSRIETIHEFITNFLTKLKEKEHNWRLPLTSAPITYDVLFETELDRAVLLVKAEVSIHLKITQSTDHLTLHARNLNIDELKLLNMSGSEVAIINYSLYAPTDMLTIYLAEDAVVGTEYQLKAKYTFNINNTPSQTAFYMTSYPNNLGTRS